MRSFTMTMKMARTAPFLDAFVDVHRIGSHVRTRTKMRTCPLSFHPTLEMATCVHAIVNGLVKGLREEGRCQQSLRSESDLRVDHQKAIGKVLATWMLSLRTTMKSRCMMRTINNQARRSCLLSRLPQQLSRCNNVKRRLNKRWPRKRSGQRPQNTKLRRTCELRLRFSTLMTRSLFRISSTNSLPNTQCWTSQTSLPWPNPFKMDLRKPLTHCSIAQR